MGYTWLCVYDYLTYDCKPSWEETLLATCGLTGSTSSESSKALVKVLARALALSEAQLGKELLPSLCDCWQHPFLACFRTDGLSFLLVVGRRLLPGPCHVVVSRGSSQHGGWLLQSQQGRENLLVVWGVTRTHTYFILTCCIYLGWFCTP